MRNFLAVRPDWRYHAPTVKKLYNLMGDPCYGPAMPRYGFADPNASALPERFYRLSWQ